MYFFFFLGKTIKNHNGLNKKEHKVLHCTANFLVAPRSYSCNFYREVFLQLKFAELKDLCWEENELAIFLGKMKSELKSMVLGSILLCRRQRLLEPPGIVNEIEGLFQMNDWH